MPALHEFVSILLGAVVNACVFCPFCPLEDLFLLFSYVVFWKQIDDADDDKLVN